MNKYCTDVIHVLYFLAVFYKRCLKIHGLPATFQKLINCIIRGMEQAGGVVIIYLEIWIIDEYMYLREQGWHSGESTRLPPSGMGSNPDVDAICGLSLLLVLSLAPRGFSLGTLVFPSPQKPTLSNSNLIWNARTRLNKFI